MRLLFLACVLALLSGCNVIRWKQRALEAELRDVKMAQSTRVVGDAQLTYWDGGEASGHRPVLLIHGFGGSALWTWTPQVVDLARDRRVVMPDLLWFGGSRSSNPDFGLDHQVEAIDALLSSLGLTEVDVVGISYGGLVASELAHAHPDRVARLVLVDSPGRIFTASDRDALLKRFSIDNFSKVLLPEDPDGVWRLITLAWANPPWVPGFARKQAFDALFSENRVEQAALLEALWTELAQARVRGGQVKAPTLIVWGRDDTVFTLELGERLARALGARLAIIENARHFPNAEHPEEFNRLLRAFLDE